MPVPDRHLVVATPQGCDIHPLDAAAPTTPATDPPVTDPPVTDPPGTEPAAASRPAVTRSLPASGPGPLGGPGRGSAGTE